MATLRVEVFSHNLKIYPKQPHVKAAVETFCRGMIKYKQIPVRDETKPGYQTKLVTVPDCVFAASPSNNDHYSVHVGQTEEFKTHLMRSGIPEFEIEWVDIPMYTPAKADIRVIPSISLYPDQVAAVNFICQPGRRKVLPAQTGRGKGLMALSSAERIGERTQVITKAGYLDKWRAEIKEKCVIDDSRILTLKGVSSILTAIERAKMGELDYDFILLSTETFRSYLKAYEAALGSDLEELYFDPRGLGCLFQIGFKIIDEAHQVIHDYFKIDLYSHDPKVLFLSATIIATDPLEQRVHDIMYPVKYRYTGMSWNQYIIATSLRYDLEEPTKAKYKDFRKNYSHVIFEQYLMRNKKKLDNYLEMVWKLTVAMYTKEYRSPQKFMIFASTIEMCNHIVAYIKPRLKLKGLTVCRYVGEDDLSSIYEHDVTVTTPGSGGTAIDVPDLRASLSTPAINSPKLVLQMLGRTRPMKSFPDLAPEFGYLTCRSIPKHNAYEKTKMDLFEGKVKKHRVQETGMTV